MTNGRFGIHGGQYMPETLMNAVIELEEAYNHYKDDPGFNRELTELLKKSPQGSWRRRQWELKLELFQAHQKVAQGKQWTPQRLIEWGQRIGMACGELIARLLQTYKHPEHGYRSCLGLLSLSRRYGPVRLEAACERALALGTLRYSHVRDLLANNRDQITPQAESDWTSPAHANLRGPGYYQ